MAPHVPMCRCSSLVRLLAISLGGRDDWNGLDITTGFASSWRRGRGGGYRSQVPLGELADFRYCSLSLLKHVHHIAKVSASIGVRSGGGEWHRKLVLRILMQGSKQIRVPITAKAIDGSQRLTLTHPVILYSRHV